MKASCIIHIKEGVVQNPAAMYKCYASLKQGTYEVDFNKLNKRSNQQNRFYHGIVVPLVQKGIEHLGTELTKEETHEFLKAKFNYKEVVNPETAQTEFIPLSTTRLSKMDFIEYVEKIQRFAAEFLNIVIPDPGQQLEVDYAD